MDTSTEPNKILSNNENTNANAYYEEKNVYPLLRKIFLMLCAIIAVAVLLFLIYQNGKSIYVNGL